MRTLLVTFADLFFLTLWGPILWAIMIGSASRWKGLKGIVVTLFLSLLPIAAAAIYFGVSYASDESFLVAGVIPWSDAAAHFSQAAAIATQGLTHLGMNGRFLYPAYFSSLLKITGLNLLAAEALGGVFFAAATTLFLRLVARLAGIAGASVVALACGLFFRERCTGLIMTENLGLLCGILAASALLIALQQRHFGMLLLGIFSLALGLVARPGAMFVLPLMILYAGSVSYSGWMKKPGAPWKRGLVGALLASMMISAAFGSNALLVHRLYDGKVIVNANFSFTLYGLLTGGKWSDALGWSHYNAPLVMQENIRLIEQEPQRLLFGACRAYKEALYRRILFMFGHESRLATMLLLLAAVGLIALWRVEAWRPYASCFTLIAAGILLSIPFAPPWDAAERPFAATLPLEALLSGIGLSVLLTADFLAKREAPHDPALRLGKYCLVLLVGIVVLLTVPLPLLYRFSPRCEAAQEAPLLLLPGSFATVTAQHWNDFNHRLTPFLNHYPAEKAFFSKLPEQPKLILGIDWKKKTFDHCALLEGGSEVTSYHYWLVDQRLLKEIEDHAHHE